jgi:hypothetical protein
MKGDYILEEECNFLSSEKSRGRFNVYRNELRRAINKGVSKDIGYTIWHNRADDFMILISDMLLTMGKR